MKQHTFVLLIVGIGLIALALFLFLRSDSVDNETQPQPALLDPDEDLTLTREQREQLVSAYIAEHISELSPVAEVLGGTFRTTDIVFIDERAGSVEYEDGHIALVADFTYTVEADGTVTVALSNVREATL